jgi:Holliday junction DNA helicase RuvB
MLAHIAAKELGVQLHERLAQVVNSMGALNGLLLQAEDKEIVFLDEIHELLPPVQTLLYRAMEGQQISLRTSEEKTLTMPLKNFTVIGATTDEFRLLRPLSDRFKIVLPFTTYDEESLEKIVLQRAQLSGIPIDPHVAVEVARRAKGTPRLAVRLLESCHRYDG